MWDDKTRTLYYQVGIGSGNAHTAGDHDIWRLPQRDDTWRAGDPVYRYIRHRPVFRLGPGGSRISPNLAGRDAAALALAYQVYRTSSPGFAAKCLRAAAHIYDLADPAPARLVTAIPFDYYPESEWRDDMELGGTELYFALAAGDPPAGLPHTDSGLLPGTGGALGRRLHSRPQRRCRHAQPLRRLRSRALRARVCAARCR